MHPLLSDPWVAERVDAALAPYVGVVSTSRLAWMREQLAETLATDPAAAVALRRAKPRTVDRSGELRVDAAKEDAEDVEDGDDRHRGAAG